ncbi:DoxX family protein [Streptomyces sp. WZ.A104]|uniref:DoxX family protein n=1 Tax=Streptomyces sp. WZ.A104 TaxID=2023771 RepID=UPI000BBC98BA|nr:DoxX family protein [Streptomyces sp. WZ.A104]PCG87678.1 DoxX family protein [Streptomyces sp. WZ.A104]
MLIRLNHAQPYALSLFRFVIGLLFACHGASSLFGVLGGNQVETGAWPGWYAALIQLVCGVLVALGLGTRAAAFLASGSMAYAYFKVHQPDGLMPIENGGGLSALFCWAFLLLVFTGPGAVAVDRLFGARSAEDPSGDASRREDASAVTA